MPWQNSFFLPGFQPWKSPRFAAIWTYPLSRAITRWLGDKRRSIFWNEVIAILSGLRSWITKSTPIAFGGFADRLAMKGLSSHVLPPANSSASKGGAWNWAARRKLLVQEFQRLPKPLAVFGFNDRVAADLIDACHTAGLLVPEEVAVLGVDNDELLCECLGIPLSSVCHDLEGMGYRAAVLLDRLMSGKRLPKLNPRITPKGIATRRSSDMMAVNDLDVAKALRFICDKFTDPLLSVDDIVAVTSVSRRPLEKAFRQELRRTINEEVLRVRLEKVKDLIITTELSVAEISQLTGFTRPNHLFRIFRRQLGMNPKQFRAQHASRARSYPPGSGPSFPAPQYSKISRHAPTHLKSPNPPRGARAKAVLHLRLIWKQIQ
jgi:AraC-like DNA-binding protein